MGENIGKFSKLLASYLSRYSLSMLSIFIDFAIIAKTFLANNFYLYGLQKFSPLKLFYVQYEIVFIKF